MDLVCLQEYWHPVSSAGHHAVWVCCGVRDPAFEALQSSCKAKAASPVCVPDQGFRGVTDGPENIHNRIASHWDAPCSQE